MILNLYNKNSPGPKVQIHNNTGPSDIIIINHNYTTSLGYFSVYFNAVGSDSLKANCGKSIESYSMYYYNTILIIYTANWEGKDKYIHNIGLISSLKLEMTMNHLPF